MKKEKLTKAFIMEAYDLFMKAAGAINEILENISDQLNIKLTRVHGASVILGGRPFSLQGHNCVVSTFGNFMDLYFVREDNFLKSWSPNPELDPEDRKYDLQLVKFFRRGEVSAEQLFTGLSSNPDELMFRIRLEPTMEEVADLYETQRLNIVDEDDHINIQYGSKYMVKVPKR